MNTSESHEFHMRRALELARLGIGTTRPNPVVGAVIVKDGRVVGEGYHSHAGGPHAEVEAIGTAGEETCGATMYVTLEPCNHEGRMPPCTQAIVEAGVGRVFFANPDPNPHVEGGGADYLRRHGIPCTEGPLSNEADYLNRGFFHWIQTCRPWVVAKFAASLDGRIATRTGESQWITGPEARQRGHELRREVDAILVGSGTVMADDPRLTVREPAPSLSRGPISLQGIVRIVLDSQGRSPLESKIFNPVDGTTTMVATTDASSDTWREALQNRDVTVLSLPSDADGRVDLTMLLDELGRREIRSVLVEGGPKVHGSFFDRGLVNEVWAFLSPMVIGGVDAPGAVAGLGVAGLSDAVRLDSVSLEHVGEDVLVRGLVAREENAPQSVGILTIKSHE